MDHLTKINQKYLVIPKLMYLTLAIAFYVFHQFRSQFIVDRYEMEKDKLGLYLSIPQAVSFLSNIWIGSVNDRSGKQKLIIVSLLLASAVFFQGFFMTTNLILFWVLFTYYFSFISATIPLLDKVMVDYVSEIPGMGPKTFGRQRVWSTFGYLITNFAVEHAITVKGKEEYNYDNMKYFNAVVVGIAVLFLYAFVKNLPRRPTTEDNVSSLKTLVGNLDYLYFIFIILLCGISRAFMTNYLGFYQTKVLKFKNQKNTLKTPWPLSTLVDMGYEHKQATTTFFGVALEIIIFFNSSIITDKLGLFWPILLAQGFQLLRFIAYYNLSYENENSFAYCCAFELLKGANYAMIHTSALQLANSFCPPYLRTTSQLFYNGTFVALGTIIAGLVFMPFFTKGSDDVAQCYQEFRTAFMWNIVFTVVGIAFFLLKYGILENLLFSRANADRKIKEIERKARRDEASHEQQLQAENPEMKKQISVASK